MRTMAPPQCGQSHAPGDLGSEASAVIEFCGEAASRSRLQTGSNSPRRRLARKPQKRIRTKPRGKEWSRNRRRKSSAVTVISRCLLGVIFPAEGDHAVGKVHDPVMEMATRCV